MCITSKYYVVYEQYLIHLKQWLGHWVNNYDTKPYINIDELYKLPRYNRVWFR